MSNEAPANQRIVHIRSLDCTFLNNTWTVTLPEAISVASDEEISIEIINASIPYSFYNVNYSNKYLSLIESELDGSNPVSWDLVLTEGNYNAITFLSMFETQLNAQSITSGKSFTYTVTYNKIKNTATITLTSSNSKTQLLFLTGNQSRYDCQYLLGFSLADFTVSYGSPLESDGSINLSPYDAIYVYSNLGIVNAYDTKTRNLTNILIKIPITSLPFSYIQYENTMNLSYKSNRTTINNLEFQMRDFDGDNIDLRNANWFLSIKFIITKKVSVFKVTRPTDILPVEI